MSNTILEQRQDVIDRLNPDKVPYLHTFDAKTGRCTDCDRRLVDEVFTDDQGRQRIHMFCAIIGPDEVERFRDYDER